MDLRPVRRVDAVAGGKNLRSGTGRRGAFRFTPAAPSDCEWQKGRRSVARRFTSRQFRPDDASVRQPESRHSGPSFIEFFVQKSSRLNQTASDESQNSSNKIKIKRKELP